MDIWECRNGTGIKKQFRNGEARKEIADAQADEKSFPVGASECRNGTGIGEKNAKQDIGGR